MQANESLYLSRVTMNDLVPTIPTDPDNISNGVVVCPMFKEFFEQNIWSESSTDPDVLSTWLKVVPQMTLHAVIDGVIMVYTHKVGDVYSICLGNAIASAGSDDAYMVDGNWIHKFLISIQSTLMNETGIYADSNTLSVIGDNLNNSFVIYAPDHSGSIAVAMALHVGDKPEFILDNATHVEGKWVAMADFKTSVELNNLDTWSQTALGVYLANQSKDMDNYMAKISYEYDNALAFIKANAITNYDAYVTPITTYVPPEPTVEEIDAVVYEEDIVDAEVIYDYNKDNGIVDTE